MTSQISHHDHFFKKFFGDISVAKDFLSIHLPENLRQQCDLNTYYDKLRNPRSFLMKYQKATSHFKKMIKIKKG
ncbi:hypothetical protein GWK90_08845 [Candidatus Hamiltonella defensa]|uniref:Transposase (putative) YhgA-like domain-containing protein n=1 Tax=Candidatus Williamhamiltonella defendens TaxID=138072 RepID=A0AAC9VMG2_9ENTR|nr:Rpn family recombination-promoting nuclease/putative transposase [Candidatus Hamiltonella defensa]ASV34486.1 hypothetical protein CJJ18_10740 [Candidatus Hamiltonella defensa]AWK17441.1 hypothetical protein CCS40_10555 [Candidatus Hamiltonella defensa]MBK4362281.1 hypothetical protein [Candidatus Hamiltonella defensa]